MPFCVFSKTAAAAFLDLSFLHFGPPTMHPLLGLMFPANSVIIFRDFGRKMLISANFAGFWPLKLYHFNPKEFSSRGTTHFDVLCVKIGSAVSSVGLFK